MVVRQIGLESITEQEFLSSMKVFFKNAQFNRYYDIENNKKTGEVLKLEKNINDIFCCKYSLAINSATQGLNIAIKALEIENSEILVPYYSFSACPLAIINTNNTPVIFNINKDLTYDLEDLERNINDKTKALMIVYMRGIDQHYKEIIKIARKYNLKIIEDISQFDLMKVNNNLGWGLLSDIAVLSFQSKKIISCGEGGALLTNNYDMYEKLFKLHDPAWDIRGLPLNNNSNHPCYPGARMNELSACLVNMQLKNLKNLESTLNENKSTLIGKIPQSNLIDGTSYNIHLLFNDIQDKKHFLQNKKKFNIYPEFSFLIDSHSYDGWNEDIKSKCKYKNEKENVLNYNLVIQTPLNWEEESI